MSDSIDHVSDTAFWVAWFRAQEGLRPDALFRDPLAAKLAGERGERLAKHMGIQRAMAWSMALRTRIIDDYILEAVEAGAGCIVNLGAGLDTRPYRLDLPAELTWIEADFPAVIAYKSGVLSDEAPRCHLSRIACDLYDAEARRRLLDQVAAVGSSALVLTEGVILYLDNAALAALANDLHEYPAITHWITDYFSPLFEKVSARGKVMKNLAQNAPFRFKPGLQSIDWSAFFARHGWQVDRVRLIGEEDRKYGREWPVNPLIAWLMAFAPEARLRPYRRMNGYVRLTRGHDVIDVEA